jgi:CheY-like chemotaxis protein
VVADGRDAVDAVARSVAASAPFDLVLMDMQMPVMDGLAATRAIRAAERAGDRRLPIIGLTANAFASDVDACRAAGMEDHIAKPVAMEALLATVDRWLRPDSSEVADGADRTIAPVAPPPAGGAGFQPSPALKAKYAEHRAGTLDQVAALVRRGTFTDEELKVVSGLLHKLAGSAGMFGEPKLGDQASGLEEGLSAWSAAERAVRVPPAAAKLLGEAA